VSRRRGIPPALRRLALVVDPALGITPAERLALEIRAAAIATGECACGATIALPSDLAPGQVHVARIEHKPDCPPVSPAGERALRRRGRRRS